MTARRESRDASLGLQALLGVEGRVRFGLTCLTVAVALILGGASRENPLHIMAVEGVGLLLLASLIADGSLIGVANRHRFEMLVLALAVSTPLLQLIPLPPSVWTALPGRQAAVDILTLADVPLGWAPLSLTPDKTLESFLWLITPVAVFVAILALKPSQRSAVVGLVLICALAGLILAGLQTAGGDDSLRLYATTHSGLPVGFFANRNHQADLMLICMPAIASVASLWGRRSIDRQRLWRMIYIGAVILFAVGALATRSRTALILLGPVIVASFIIFWTAAGTSRQFTGRNITIAVLAVALIAVAQIGLAAVLSRFDALADQEARFQAWPTVEQGSIGHQPFGAGLGTFDAVFRSVETIGFVTESYFNHAHNDYLELWLETGIIFPVALVLFAAWFFRASIIVWRRAEKGNHAARAGTVIVAILLAHSMADYPLRTHSLVVMFAMGAALLAAGSSRSLSEGPRRRQGLPAGG